MTECNIDSAKKQNELSARGNVYRAVETGI